MKKLNDRQFEWWLKRVRDMKSEEHQDFNVQILLADLWFTLAEENNETLEKGIIAILNPFRMWKHKARKLRVISATLAHEDCCKLYDKN